MRQQANASRLSTTPSSPHPLLRTTGLGKTSLAHIIARARSEFAPQVGTGVWAAELLIVHATEQVIVRIARNLGGAVLYSLSQPDFEFDIGCTQR